ncbi:MAG: wax ester/triacylglycerol synthase domain-containing protein [Porticoccaceae bacterium]
MRDLSISAAPLWEMCVIEGLDNIEGMPKSSFAIATKLHHAVIDGHTTMEITWNLHDTTPNARRVIKRTPEEPQRAPGAFGKLARMAINNATHAAKMVPPLVTALPPLASWIMQKTLRNIVNSSAATPVPKIRFQQDVSQHRVWDMVNFSLNDLKKSAWRYREQPSMMSCWPLSPAR